MPTYEYACQACGTHVEVYQRFSDEPLTECGVCGGRLRKVFHPAGILFKGSGFYATDSRGSRGRGEPASEKKESAKGPDGGSKAPAAKDKPASSSSGGATKERSA